MQKPDPERNTAQDQNPGKNGMDNERAVEPLLDLRLVLLTNGISIEALHTSCHHIADEKDKDDQRPCQGIQTEIHLAQCVQDPPFRKQHQSHHHEHSHVSGDHVYND